MSPSEHYTQPQGALLARHPADDPRRHHVTTAAIAARLAARRRADDALARGDGERASFYLGLERRRARLVLRLLSLPS